MIRSHRSIEAPTLGARHEVTAWIEQRARAHSMRTAGLVCDDRLYQRAFGRADAGRRSVVTLVARGRAYFSWGPLRLVIGAGEGIYLPTRADLAVRTEGDAYESVVVEWDTAISPSPRRLRADDAQLAAIGARLRDAPAPDPEVIAALVGLLAGTGAPIDGLRFDGETDLGPAERRAQEIADALDAVLSSLDAQPMATDLEARLGVTARQVTRLVDAFRRRYGYGATNWLQTRNRRRLMLAATLLTARGAGVAKVASAVGYRRPETLARAFATAGFPRPREIHAEVARLGARWREEVARAERVAPEALPAT